MFGMNTDMGDMKILLEKYFSSIFSFVIIGFKKRLYLDNNFDNILFSVNFLPIVC